MKITIHGELYDFKMVQVDYNEIDDIMTVTLRNQQDVCVKVNDYEEKRNQLIEEYKEENKRLIEEAKQKYEEEKEERKQRTRIREYQTLSFFKRLFGGEKLRRHYLS